MDLALVFFTGLTVGGVTCLSLQGGLLASVLAAKSKSEERKLLHAVIGTIAFLVSKFFAHVILGFLLGLFGKIITLSDTMQSVLQLIAGVYMIIIALHLLDVHPVFRYFIIQPPKFLARLIKNQTRSQSIFAPAILGVFTVFIPCGTTLAMEALAVASGNGMMGALILGVFTLGTMPLFLGVGSVISVFGSMFRDRFLQIAAVLVIVLGAWSINGSLVALGSPITFRSVLEASPLTIVFPELRPRKNISNVDIRQNHEITVHAYGYSPSYIRVRRGEEVVLRLKSENTYSCALAFRIPSLGISTNLQPTDTQVIRFTPKEKGMIQFSCSMGMYSGIIEVI